MNDMFYKNHHSKNTSDIFRKKRTENTLNLIHDLSLDGPSTTNEIATTALGRKQRDTKKIMYKEKQIIQRIYYNLIQDRQKYDKYKKVSGLLSTGYIRNTGTKINDKKLKVKLYFLTQKGHFFSFGFNFRGDDFKLFLKHASKNNLFFAYMKSIYEKTSENFVRDIFVIPILEIIDNEKIHLDNNFNFYFVNIAQSIGNSLYKKYYKILEEDNPKKFEAMLKNIKMLMDNTFYFEPFSNEWIESLVAHYYPNDSKEDFYYRYRNESDSQLLYAVFRAVYLAYYTALGFGVPKPKRILPIPKGLKEHYKRKIEQKKKRFSFNQI